ncbi:MAG: ECF transporter S component [Clostridia bacterium]|nr:ECF transporter S component [Clostridia bacterium]
MEKANRRPDTRRLARASALSALIIVMTVVPYTGYINYGLIEITTLHIVVAVGAVMLGWRYGAVLGFVWGASCVVRALTNPLWAPFVNPLVSLVPRVLVGMAAGLVAEGMRRAKCRPMLSAAVAGAAATVTNTVLVLSALKLFSAVLEGAPLLGTIYGTLIGINGVIELAAAVLLVPAVIAALQPRETVLGVDIGASTTKLALVQRGRCVKTMRKPDDMPLEEALERFGTAGVKRVALTGVGASYVTGDLRGLPTRRVDEFLAVSRGAAHCAKSHNCLVVSVGTGTSFVRMTPFRAWHVGGSGVGGGMLESLGAQLCGAKDMETLQNLAMAGELSHVDLQLRDVCAGTIGNLLQTSTVSNLKKIDETTEPADMAAGLCNLIFQSIGVMAAFAVKKHLTRKIVLIGTITDWKVAPPILDEVAKLHRVRFAVPDRAAFATAIGAALLHN